MDPTSKLQIVRLMYYKLMKLSAEYIRRFDYAGYKKLTNDQIINYVRILWQMEYIENMHTLILRCKNALLLRTDGLIILYLIGLEIEYI